MLPAQPRADASAGVAGLPFLTGFVEGAANPGPFVNWTLFISFLIGRRLLDPSPAGAGGFALGVGLGVFSWFTLLIRAAHRLKDRSGSWVARSTVVAGAFLLATGLYFGWRSLAASVGPFARGDVVVQCRFSQATVSRMPSGYGVGMMPKARVIFVESNRYSRSYW